jgi:alpha-1,3-rhamnosyltransferase
MTEQQPLVSIVIPCYNHSQFVQETIQSIIDQDYENIELIIIDDGSKDNSVEVIQEMIPACEERFVRFEFRYRPNKGLCATLNEALEWCEGEFFAPVASDDIYLPGKITPQVKYLLNNLDCGAVFSGAKVTNEKGDTVVIRPAKNKKYFFKDIFLNRYSLFTPSQLLRLKLIRDVGGFDERVMLEDWYIFLRISEAGYSLDSLAGVNVCYRRHLNNTTNNPGLMHLEREKVLNIFADSLLYKDAYAEFLFTKAREILPYSKIDTIKFLTLTFFRKPKALLRMSTLKVLVKLFIPKVKLQKLQKGI